MLALSCVLSSVDAQVSAVRTGAVAPQPFQHRVLAEAYYAEGAGYGDFNRDGKVDVVSGPFWYEGPGLTRRHTIYPPRRFPIGFFADNFFVYGTDVDRDGWDDVLVIGFPGTAAHWYENPKQANGTWKRHLVWPLVDFESPAFVDIDRDGRSELVCATLGRLGFLKPDPKDARRPWSFHAISPRAGWNAFTHGLGVGDVDGDGRADVLTSLGWFRQPASLRGDPLWQAHPVAFGVAGSQMYAYDVDGDGDNDVITAVNAHGYGLSWFEHTRNGSSIRFREHTILPRAPTRRGLQFSQLHAVQLADIDGDGLLDIVTGKTFWAHNGADPGAREPAVLYWFRLVRKGPVRFEPRFVSMDVGIGRQISVTDLDGDRRPDLIVGNKHGAHVWTQRAP